MRAPDRPLRVLALARSYPNNVIDTLGTWTEWPARELAKLCDLRVVSPVPYCPPMPPWGPLRQYVRFRAVAREEIRNGIRVYHPRFAIAPGSTLPCFEHRSYGAAVRRLVENMRSSFSFDLIHAHFSYPDGVVAAHLSRRYGVPFLITDQAPWIPWLERGCIRRAVLPAAREAAHVTAVSRYLRGTILHYLGDQAAVQVVPNGVDENVFRLSEHPLTERRDQIVYVGLINFNKGIDVLLKAMTQVLARRSSTRLVLVGGSYYRRTRLEEHRIRQLAHSLSLDANVLFAGRLPPSRVAEVMRESTVLVLPSRAETFGAVLVEALASGTPVVATRSGGPDDIVTENVGRLVPVGDPAALADALLSVLEHPERYEPRQLRRYALERFRWSAIANEYRRLYDVALGWAPQRAQAGGQLLSEPS